jgi:hypothetical protein
MSVVDVVLGSLLFALIGWTLVQCASPSPGKRGCGGGCGPAGCGPEQSPDDEQLATLPRAGEREPER